MIKHLYNRLNFTPYTTQVPKTKAFFVKLFKYLIFYFYFFLKKVTNDCFYSM